jgi:hypothetical protein
MCRICVALVQQGESGTARVIGHRCTREKNSHGHVERESTSHSEECQLGPYASFTPVQTTVVSAWGQNGLHERNTQGSGAMRSRDIE